MKTILHTADSRGHANHGWLDTYYSFSFASYRDPEKINFGALRVLNDDTIAPGMGFGLHPHDNMEIVSIPLEGALEHKDNMGNVAVIRHGEVQVMSAGTGIMHSEFNRNKNEQGKFLQIWIIPATREVQPRYDQISIKDIQKDNSLFRILSPNPDDVGVWIHQEAWFHMGYLKKDFHGKYVFKGKNHGVYAFVIEGKVDIAGQELSYRDALGIWETDDFDISVKEDAHLLLMEVPMIV
nr:pirin family protein [Bacteroidota bacterium]